MSSTRFPAEWEQHEAVWSAWPSAVDLWEDDLAPAREEIADLFKAIAQPDPEDPGVRGETVHVLWRGSAAHDSATDMLGDLIADGRLCLHEAPIGDIWLRDTGPIFTVRKRTIVPTAFGFNGWGGKYFLPDDDKISTRIADLAGLSPARQDFIMEGGAIDTDGEGTLLTTRQCVLNANRNDGMTEERFERLVGEALGIEKVIWLDDGLLNDHTDGHVDNIARFIAPGRIACMKPSGQDDPNAEVYRAILDTLRGQTDAGGRPLEIIDVPSPGRIVDGEGQIIPASYMNFYIANHSIIVPVYAENEEQERYMIEAVETLGEAAGRDHVYAIGAHHTLTGGGSFHCITQQQPSLVD